MTETKNKLDCEGIFDKIINQLAKDRNAIIRLYEKSKWLEGFCTHLESELQRFMTFVKDFVTGRPS